MGVNHINAINPEKVKHFGKLFGTIDFVLTNDTSSQTMSRNYQDSTVGEFRIGGSIHKVTVSELKRIIETAESALSIVNKAYKFGHYGR